MAEIAQNRDCNIPQLMAFAERELGAFISAVRESFGPEQARLSAEDWVSELECMNGLPEKTAHDWRRITIAASARLTARVMNARRRNYLSAAPSLLWLGANGSPNLAEF